MDYTKALRDDSILAVDVEDATSEMNMTLDNLKERIEDLFEEYQNAHETELDSMSYRMIDIDDAEEICDELIEEEITSEETITEVKRLLEMSLNHCGEMNFGEMKNYVESAMKKLMEVM